MAMPSKGKTGAVKGGKKSIQPSKPRSSAKPKSKVPIKTTQQKTKSSASTATKKKPPHMRYTEAQLKVPLLNGIRPAGVQKPPNAKKGKNFVEDREQMNAILAIVMAEKEGNIESKMMKARQLEEVREARKAEADSRAEIKRKGFEGRKREIADDSRRNRRSDPRKGKDSGDSEEKFGGKKLRKKVSFG